MTHDPYQSVIICAGCSGVGADFLEHYHGPTEKMPYQADAHHMDADKPTRCTVCGCTFPSVTGKARYCPACYKAHHDDYRRNYDKQRYAAARERKALDKTAQQCV